MRHVEGKDLDDIHGWRVYRKTSREIFGIDKGWQIEEEAYSWGGNRTAKIMMIVKVGRKSGNNSIR